MRPDVYDLSAQRQAKLVAVIKVNISTTEDASADASLAALNANKRSRYVMHALATLAFCFVEWASGVK